MKPRVVSKKAKAPGAEEVRLRLQTPIKNSNSSDKTDKTTLFSKLVSKTRVVSEGKNTLYDFKEKNMNGNNKRTTQGFVYSDLTIDAQGTLGGFKLNYMALPTRTQASNEKEKSKVPNLLVLAGTLTIDKKELIVQTPKLFKVIRATGQLIVHEVSGDEFDSVKLGDNFELVINEIEENKTKKLQWTINRC